MRDSCRYHLHQGLASCPRLPTGPTKHPPHHAHEQEETPRPTLPRLTSNRNSPGSDRHGPDDKLGAIIRAVLCASHPHLPAIFRLLRGASRRDPNIPICGHPKPASRQGRRNCFAALRSVPHVAGARVSTMASSSTYVLPNSHLWSSELRAPGSTYLSCLVCFLANTIVAAGR